MKIKGKEQNIKIRLNLEDNSNMYKKLPERARIKIRINKKVRFKFHMKVYTFVCTQLG
ncbi:hypothetical protein PGB90_002138 [Kerria lacca]